jgi:hypothetical protein
MRESGGGDGRIRPVTRKQASLRERLDYMESGLATELGLREAIRRLGLRGLSGADSGQRQQLEVRIRTLETAIDDVHDDLISYLTNESTVRPLGSATCEIIRARAHQLLGLPPDTLPFEVLEIARELTDTWDLTRPAAPDHPVVASPAPPGRHQENGHPT